MSKYNIKYYNGALKKCIHIIVALPWRCTYQLLHVNTLFETYVFSTINTSGEKMEKKDRLKLNPPISNVITQLFRDPAW